MKAQDFYNNLEEKKNFTKLTNTGITDDLDNVFEFAEAYCDARMQANDADTGNDECHIQNVSNCKTIHYSVGDNVIVKDCVHGHEFEIGEEVTITEVRKEEEDYRVENEATHWFVQDSEIKSVE